MKTLKNNKGFTLIEIVIVIVIIAILAAMLVPSMLSWIDSANQRTFLSACDSIETSVLTVASENYATDGTFGISDSTTKKWADVTKLVGDTVQAGKDHPTDDNTYNVDLKVGADNKLTNSVIYDKNYKGVCGADGSWTVTKKGAAS